MALLVHAENIKEPEPQNLGIPYDLAIESAFESFVANRVEHLCVLPGDLFSFKNELVKNIFLRLLDGLISFLKRV